MSEIKLTNDVKVSSVSIKLAPDYSNVLASKSADGSGNGNTVDSMPTDGFLVGTVWIDDNRTRIGTSSTYVNRSYGSGAFSFCTYVREGDYINTKCPSGHATDFKIYGLR